MTKKSKVISISSLLAVVGIVGALGFAGVSYAHERNDVDHQEHRAEMDQIFADRDYEAWKEVIESKPKITDYVNEENFDRFAEMHELMQSGDKEAADEIRKELGLPEKMGKKGKGMHGKRFQ